MALFGNGKLNTTIGIDARSSCFVFYTMTGDDKLTAKQKRVPFKGALFDENFYNQFSDGIAEYLKQTPSQPGNAYFVVAPDNVTITDVIAVPALGKKAMETAFKSAVDNVYVNSADLQINKFLAATGKQSYTYAVTMMQKNIISGLNRVCNANKISPQFVTSPANATINAVAKLRPKYRRSSYLFVDVKDGYTRIVFCAKGRATGSAILPFGFEVFNGRRLVAEDMLFNHSLGDITVLNAKAKARDKQVAIVHEEPPVEPETPEENPLSEGEVPPPDDGLVTEESEIMDGLVKEDDELDFQPESWTRGYRKTARKLPKFMQKPNPTDEQGYVYENFCLVAKWVLLFLRNNEQLTMQGTPEFVLVNMPHKFDYLFEMANRHKDDNKIDFVAFDPAIEDNAEITSNLEYFGGFYSKRVNPTNLF